MPTVNGRQASELDVYFKAFEDKLNDLNEEDKEKLEKLSQAKSDLSFVMSFLKFIDKYQASNVNPLQISPQFEDFKSRIKSSLERCGLSSPPGDLPSMPVRRPPPPSTKSGLSSGTPSPESTSDASRVMVMVKPKETPSKNPAPSYNSKFRTQPEATIEPQDLETKKRMIQEAMPALSEKDRSALAALALTVEEKTSVELLPMGIRVDGKEYIDYLHQYKDSKDLGAQNAYQAYLQEKRIYQALLKTLKPDDLDARQSAESMLIALTKAHGGYAYDRYAEQVKIYRGGSLGFETRVMSRAVAFQQGLLRPNETQAEISDEESRSYTAKIGLSSKGDEVIVSSKSYGNNYQTIIVQEPHVVRDCSKPTKDPLIMHEKAMQMAMMFAMNHQPGKPAIIRGGNSPEFRKLVHAYLLLLKYASKEGQMGVTLRSVFGMQGKTMSEIDLKDLRIVSDSGPRYCRRQSLLERGFHSVDHAQKTEDLRFIKGVLGDEGMSLFEAEKRAFLNIRDQYRHTSSSKSRVTFIEDAVTDEPTKRPKQ